MELAELSPTTGANNRVNSTDRSADRKFDHVRQRYDELSNHIQRIHREHRMPSSTNLSNVLQYVDNTFFYESAAQFGFHNRLNHFFSSLRVGDRFVAKVINVFERSANVVLIWSSKRDIHDLKVKAYLRLVESNRYRNNTRVRHAICDLMNDRNLDVSELIYVELVYVSEDGKKLEVIRRKSLIDNDLIDDNEVDDGLLNEEKYRPKSPSQISFHNYMVDHDNLRNPFLTKQPAYTSLLHHNQFIECYRGKLEKKRHPAMAHILIDDEVTLLEQPKLEANVSPKQYPLPSKSDRFKIKSRDGINNDDNHKEIKLVNDSQKSIHHSIMDKASNTKRSSSHSVISLSSSSSNSETSECESGNISSSSESSNDSRQKHKRKHRKSKSHHDKKRHKKRSKKHSKKKKIQKCKHRKHSHERKKKKIDDEILQLLSMTK